MKSRIVDFFGGFLLIGILAVFVLCVLSILAMPVAQYYCTLHPLYGGCQ
jgi:hypothetical protein